MRPPRVTIGGLMTAVAVMAVGLAAAREPSGLLTAMAFTTALGVLLAAILGAALRRGPARGYWLGFALFGWAYLLATLGPWVRDEVEPHLPTTRILAEIHLRRFPMPGQEGSFERWQNGSHGYVTGTPFLHWSNERENFFRVGHSLSALAVGVFGGLVGRRLAAAPRDGGEGA